MSSLKWPLGLVAALAMLLVGASANAQILTAHPGPANNGGSAGWGIFFDLTSTAALPVHVSGMTTASTAPAGETFSVEVFTRPGTALGGPVGSGPGSSPAGWTSLGTASVTQGPVSSQESLPFTIPTIVVNPGEQVGVALVFAGAGPRYFGTGTPPYGTYSDANLMLVTGDARSQPFTTGGTWFASRELVGSVAYTVIPEPATASLLLLAGVGALRRRR